LRERIGGAGLIGPEPIGELFQAAFLGHGGAGTPFRTVWRVKVFESVDGGGLLDPGAKLISQEIAFLKRFENGGAAGFQFEQLGGAVANGGDRDFIKGTGGFLAVAGDERDRRPFGQKGAYG